ncbi:hypothetical protein DPMN_079616 [Dreissena polymorpha]|uniref:Uncharacterized protein n=1 Tax=Dreissena polymorpha TaxID=45954 RepID=A0A9D3YTH4_DREPO|nr:hypothetical protein DPMN_079616 [Dreissena polymorpha]
MEDPTQPPVDPSLLRTCSEDIRLRRPLRSDRLPPVPPRVPRLVRHLLQPLVCAALLGHQPAQRETHLHW